MASVIILMLATLVATVSHCLTLSDTTTCVDQVKRRVDYCRVQVCRIWIAVD